MPKRLCEKVCYLVFCGNMKCFDCCKDLLSDGMAVDLYMFGLFMEDRVCSNIRSCLAYCHNKKKLSAINHTISLVIGVIARYFDSAGDLPTTLILAFP